MKVFELSVKVYLIHSLKHSDLNTEICRLIDNSLSKEEQFLKIHNQNKYKFYTFNSLYPIERDGVYKGGSIYTFLLRTIDEKLSEYFKKYLENEYTKGIKVLAIETKIIPKKNVERIYSITPAVAKFPDGYWRKNYSVDIFEKRIRENLIKKYNDYFRIKISENFELFNFVEFHNRKPIAVKYKNIKILGDKITLNIASNEMAQKLAYFAIGVGILEMNSRGMGFVNFKSF